MKGIANANANTKKNPPKKNPKKNENEKHKKGKTRTFGFSKWVSEFVVILLYVSKCVSEWFELMWDELRLRGNGNGNGSGRWGWGLEWDDRVYRRRRKEEKGERRKGSFGMSVDGMKWWQVRIGYIRSALLALSRSISWHWLILARNKKG